MIVGKVDSTGSGVPFKLCNINTNRVVIAVTTKTDMGIEKYLLSILTSKTSSNLMMAPPKRNV